MAFPQIFWGYSTKLTFRFRMMESICFAIRYVGRRTIIQLCFNYRRWNQYISPPFMWLRSKSAWPTFYLWGRPQYSSLSFKGEELICLAFTYGGWEGGNQYSHHHLLGGIYRSHLDLLGRSIPQPSLKRVLCWTE